jgi:C4-dicarboxylate-specific signal transduction histidine kinase
LHTEAEAIAAHVGHIRTIVAAQQTYARRGGVTEQVDIAELVDNAVTIHFTSTPDVTIKREYEALPPVILDRHKLLQILGNLLSNARHALKDQTTGARVLTLRIHGRASGWFVVEVQDTGAGISGEAQKRIFEFGFTTKKDGHGFGLHSSSILAKELGGHLAGFSDGPERGAQFALRLPLTSAAQMSTPKGAAVEGGRASEAAA